MAQIAFGPIKGKKKAKKEKKRKKYFIFKFGFLIPIILFIDK